MRLRKVWVGTGFVPELGWMACAGSEPFQPELIPASEPAPTAIAFYFYRSYAVESSKGGTECPPPPLFPLVMHEAWHEAGGGAMGTHKGRPCESEITRFDGGNKEK